MMTACDAHTVTATDSQGHWARAEFISTRPSGRAREKINCRTPTRAKVTPIAMLLVPAITAAACARRAADVRLKESSCE